MMHGQKNVKLEPLVQNIENDTVQLKVLTCYWALCTVML